MKKKYFILYAIAFVSSILLLILLNMALDYTTEDLSFRLTTLGFIVGYLLYALIVISAIINYMDLKNKPYFIFVMMFLAFEIIDTLASHSMLEMVFVFLFFEPVVVVISFFMQREKIKKRMYINNSGYNTNGSENNMSDINESSKANPQAKTLGPGMVTLMFQNIRIISIVVAVVTIIATIILIEDKYYTIGVIVFDILLALFLVLVFTNPLSNATKKYLTRNLDYEGFINQCENWKKTQRLHPDTISFITALEANVLAFEDQEKYKELFASTSYPFDKRLNQIYSILKFSYCLNIRDFEQAQYLIRIQKYPRQKDILMRGYTLYTTTDIIPNIEAYYRINTRSKFNNIVYAADLMRYYWTRGDKDRSKYYADFIRNQNTGYTYLTDLVNRVLNDEDIPDYNIYKSQDGE